MGCTYLAEPLSPSRSRLLVKMCVAYSARGLRGLPMRLLFPPGDLVMMRRQLLNLKALAERSQELRLREQAEAEPREVDARAAERERGRQTAVTSRGRARAPASRRERDRADADGAGRGARWHHSCEAD